MDIEKENNNEINQEPVVDTLLENEQESAEIEEEVSIDEVTTRTLSPSRMVLKRFLKHRNTENRF